MKFDTQSSTIIGSLPCTDPMEALGMLERHPPVIPAWPQLPKRSFREGMVLQYTEGLPGIRIDERERRVWIERDDTLPSLYAEFYERIFSGNPEDFAISAGYAAGLAAFLDARGSEPKKVPAIKGQVAGPLTVGLSLGDSSGVPAWFDDQYRDVLIKSLTHKALWQIGRLRSLAETVIIFFDEPIFAALGTPAYIGVGDDQVTGTYEELCTELHAAGAVVGIHCCGNMDWGLLTRTSIDIISFDAYSFSEKVTLYAAEIGAFLERGGWLAWGLVPTGNAGMVARESAAGIRRRREDLVALFTQKGVERDRLMQQMLVTPSCGMGTLPAASAERALDLLDQLRRAG